MSRRYRLALLAYPPAFRATHGPEMLATLSEGDARRGAPSSREACSLVIHGIAQRCAPSGGGNLLGLIGTLALLLALTPDGWWAHSSLTGGPDIAPGVVGPPDEARTPLGLAGLLAMAAVAPRAATVAGMLVPYAWLVSGGLGMGYGRDAFMVSRIDLPALALATTALGIGVSLLAHASRASGARARGLAALALLLCAFTAVATTLDAIGSHYGSGGPTVPVGPTPIGALGPALLLCVAITLVAATITAQAVRSARAGRPLLLRHADRQSNNGTPS